MLSIVSIMAPLTQGSQIAWVVILRLIVKVGDSKHDIHHLLRLLIVVVGVVSPIAELAPIMGTFQYLRSYIAIQFFG